MLKKGFYIMKTERYMDALRRREREQRGCFYHDPLESWIERHQVVSGLVAAFLAWVLLVLAFSI
jgi:hypothetical protein